MCARVIVVTTTYVRMRVVFCMCVFTVANCSNYGQEREGEKEEEEEEDGGIEETDEGGEGGEK